MSKLHIRGLTHSFNLQNTKLNVLEDLNFKVNEAEFIALLGPSGCGKSTLFNIIAGLIPPESGAMFLNGEYVDSHTDAFGYMQQKDLLLPWRTVLKNVLIGPEIRKDTEEYVRSKALSLLSQLGLQGFENSYPNQLSGGMRQRVALVRTLLCNKEFLLLDEPFGALDAMTRTVMQTILLEMWGKKKQTVLLITHDVEEALCLADRIIVLTPRPASIKSKIDINLERPRCTTDISYINLKKEIIDILTLDTNQVFSMN
ncbi:ABC transporter [Candidatus Poribacteria bacterium]|nr:MAG: ABC transporter [Candidatus Poribacteria bacterium]